MAKIITETTSQEVKSPHIGESLFREVGLTELVAETYLMRMRAEARNQNALLSLRDYLRVLGKMMVLLYTDAETRAS